MHLRLKRIVAPIPIDESDLGITDMFNLGMAVNCKTGSGLVSSTLQSSELALTLQGPSFKDTAKTKHLLRNDGCLHNFPGPRSKVLPEPLSYPAKRPRKRRL